MKDLYDVNGKWYKGNLHTHTTRSDGRKTPEEASELYYSKGYDFISLTDHKKPSKTSQYKGMTLISGAEWDIGQNNPYPVYHILSIGTESDLDLMKYYQDKEHYISELITPQDIVDRINEAGGAAILAHPCWSVMQPDEMFMYRGFAGAEVYNSVSRTPWNSDRPDSTLYFDLWAKKGLYIPCTAADDSHFYEGEECFAFTMVNAPSNSEKDIVNAIKNGNYYASLGPKFDRISYDEKTVEVYCSDDVVQVIFYSNTAWVGGRVKKPENGKAVYQINPNDTYVRIELYDAEGKKAWSKPFAVNEK